MNPHPKYQDKKRYKRVCFDGASFVDTPENVALYLAGADQESQYLVTDVWLTPYQFESLPEFMGF